MNKGSSRLFEPQQAGCMYVLVESQLAARFAALWSLGAGSTVDEGKISALGVKGCWHRMVKAYDLCPFGLARK